MVAGTVNGNRLAALCEPASEPVEVIQQHVSRRKIINGFYPKSDLRLLPTSVRVSVETAAGLAMRVMCRVWCDCGYVYASARPCGQLEGEDYGMSGAFSLEDELRAERLALESL